MTTPAIVEKELHDLSLSGGVNERDRPETLDWTKYLTVCENMVWDQAGSLVKRPGWPSYLTTLTDNTSRITESIRLFSGTDSFLSVSREFYLQQPDESARVMQNKGKLPEVSVKGRALSSSSVIGSITPGTDLFGAVTDTAVSDQYFFFARQNRVGNNLFGVVEAYDRHSFQQVRTWTLALPALVTSAGIALQVVSGTHLHIFWQSSTATDQKYAVVSLSALTVSGTLSGTNLPSTGAARTILGAGVGAGGTSVVVTTDATDTWVNKISANGGVTASMTIAGFNATGWDTQSGVLYLCSVDAAPQIVIKTVNTSTMAVTATNNTGVDPGAYNTVRLAVNTSLELRLVGYGPTATVTATVDMATAAIYSVSDPSDTPVFLGYMAGVMELTHPFYHKGDTDTEYCYLGVTKVRQSVSGTTRTNDVLGQALLVDISYLDTSGNATAWRPVAVLDNYTSLATGGVAFQGLRSTNTNLQRPRFGREAGGTLSTNTCFIGLEERISPVTRGYEVAECVFYDARCLAYQNRCISNGMLTSEDGVRATENGFVDSPDVYLTDSGAGAGPGAGTYNYLAVYVAADAAGRTHFSRVSGVSSIVMAGANAPTVQVSAPLITYRNINTIPLGGVARCDVYRTTSGGTQFFYLTTISTYTGVFGTYTDVISDATLATRPLLYRQPGTPGTALDRYPALASSALCQHKDRLFTCRRNTVYYSSFFLDGEAIWFNPAFSFPVQGGSGDITALASLDDLLVVFKEDGIWVVDGDGPPENGGTGTEFGVPRRINSEYGCVDQRTVVSVPDGIMFRSQRGLELLTKGLKVIWVGELVQDTVFARPFSGGACYDRENARVLFPMATSVSSFQGWLGFQASGAVLCYDVTMNAWSVLKSTNTDVTVQDAVFVPNLYFPAELKSRASVVLCVSDESSPSPILHTDGETYTDFTDAYTNKGFVSYRADTGWVKLGSLQDRYRFSDFLVLAKKITNHNLSVSVAYDYSDTYAYTKTWAPAQINPLSLEQLELQVPKQAVMSVRFKVTDAIPADTTTYPVTTGKGAELLALTVKGGIRGGGAKLPADAKG